MHSSVPRSIMSAARDWRLASASDVRRQTSDRRQTPTTTDVSGAHGNSLAHLRAERWHLQHGTSWQRLRHPWLNRAYGCNHTASSQKARRPFRRRAPMLRPPYYYYHYAYDHRQRPAGRRVSRYDVVAHVQRPRWFVLLLVVFTELRDMLPAMSGAPRCRVAPGAAAPAVLEPARRILLPAASRGVRGRIAEN